MQFPSLLVLKGQSQVEWQVVFYTAAAIYLASALFYMIFASGEVQKWAVEEKTQDVEEMNMLEDKAEANKSKDLEI